METLLFMSDSIKNIYAIINATQIYSIHEQAGELKKTYDYIMQMASKGAEITADEIIKIYEITKSEFNKMQSLKYYEKKDIEKALQTYKQKKNKNEHIIYSITRLYLLLEALNAERYNNALISVINMLAVNLELIKAGYRAIDVIAVSKSVKLKNALYYYMRDNDIEPCAKILIQEISEEMQKDLEKTLKNELKKQKSRNKKEIKKQEEKRALS